MADKTPEERFTEALESIREIVLHEITLIDIDLDERREVTGDPLQLAGLQKTADDDKKDFLKDMRGDLELIIEKIAQDRKDPWLRVDQAFHQRFPEVEILAAARAEARAAALILSGAPPAQAPVRSFALCPPGFEEVDGICVRIVN